MSDSTSQPSSWTAKSGKFALLSRAIKHSDIHHEVLFLQSRKSFEYFFCFHRTLGISPKDLEGLNTDIAFIYTTLACSLAPSTNLNFDLTFVTRNFIGSCFIRWMFWLVSRKDDCLERELIKTFWIKKLTNKIPIFCRINFKKYFIKSRGWDNLGQLCKSETKTKSRVCITVPNYPNPSRVYIRLCKHGKRFLLL